MMLPKILLSVFVILCLAFGALAHEEHQHVSGNPEKVGTVHFPISCNAEVQQPFERAVALLHSFWFEEAGKGFTSVTEMDPNCASGTASVEKRKLPNAGRVSSGQPVSLPSFC